MPTYSYRAVDEHGVRVRGQSAATTERALQEELRARGALLLEARQHESGQHGRTLFRSDGVVRFTRSLASLLAAGLPISRALRTAAAIESGDVRSAALELCSRIERGEAIAQALAARADLFSPVYIGHVRAGEAVGDVAGALSRIASQLEAEASFRKRLVSASVYPAVLLVMSISATAVLLVFILPRFAALLAGTGAALPVTTRVLLAIGPVAGTAAPWVLLLGLLVGITIHRQAGAPAGRERLSYLGFHLPLVGSIRRDVAAARFARVLSGLLPGAGQVP